MHAEYDSQAPPPFFGLRFRSPVNEAFVRDAIGLLNKNNAQKPGAREMLQFRLEPLKQLAARCLAAAPRPHCVTSSDIVNATLATLAESPAKPNGFSELLSRLELNLHDLACASWGEPRRTPKYEIGMYADEYSQCAITDPAGWSVIVNEVFRLVFRGPVKSHHSRTAGRTEFAFEFEAFMSPKAFRASAQESRRVLRSLLQTLREAGHFDVVRSLRDLKTMYRTDQIDAAEWGVVSFVDIDGGCATTVPRPRPDQTGLELVGRLLTLYWWPRADSKAKLSNRLHRALRLIVEGDRQKDADFRLVLYTAALESLLGSKELSKEGLAQYLSRQAAYLLEPDVARRAIAVKGVKRLYDKRSTIVHGAGSVDDPKVTQAVRRLVSGVTKAIVEWQRCSSTLEAKKSEDEQCFFDQIKDAEFKGEVIGVPRVLWRCLPESDDASLVEATE